MKFFLWDVHIFVGLAQIWSFWLGILLNLACMVAPDTSTGAGARNVLPGFVSDTLFQRTLHHEVGAQRQTRSSQIRLFKGSRLVGYRKKRAVRKEQPKSREETPDLSGHGAANSCAAPREII